MKTEFRIKTNDIESTDVPGIMAEIEAMNLEIPGMINFDIEAAASHIMYNDEDYVIEYDDGEIETVNLAEILENIKADKYTDREMSSLPTSGDAPREDTTGIWSWDGTHAIVGEGFNDMEIVPYSYFDEDCE